MYTKNIKFAALAFVLILSSCSQLLDIDEEGQISGDVLVDTESIEQALVGAYYNLGGTNDGNTGGQLFGGDFILIPTLLSKNNGTEYIWSSSQATDYLVFTERDGNANVKIIATNARVQQNWVRAYETINLCNSILANINNVTDASARERIEGEALAIRSVLYFEMVRLWGPDISIGATAPAIPLIAEPFEDINKIETPTLATVSQVYDQIFTDLTEASTLLESAGRNGTSINYYACQTYLARLSMHRGDFGAAKDYADNVLDAGPFSLVSEPYLAYNNAINSTEDVYAIQQSLANNSGDRTSGTGIVSFMSSLTESGIGQFAIIASSLNSTFLANTPVFNIGDLRAGVLSGADRNTTAAQLQNALYYPNLVNLDPSILSSAKFTGSQNVIPVIRLAELYLIRAEALYETTGVTQQAVNDLNELRTRAGIAAVDLTDFSASADIFLDSIKLESKREFIFEGHLLHNLRRWGDIVGSSFDSEDPLDNKFLFDIPQSERDTWTD
ncbi:MAG: hypothetical protein ACJASN_001723 [Cyclobacteriaceae bacterium]|jgi:hypothetical protein